MRAEGYIVDTKKGTTLEVLASSMKPNAKFPQGGFMLRTVGSAKLLLAYRMPPRTPSKTMVLSGMKEAALEEGLLLVFRGLDDDLIEELERGIEDAKQ